MIITKKKLQEIIYKTIITTCRATGKNLSETKKLMIYNEITNKKGKEKHGKRI